MPAYAKDGTIVCHFQPAQKFKTRYPTLGFSDKANLDDGTMWPVAYALTKAGGRRDPVQAAGTDAGVPEGHHRGERLVPVVAGEDEAETALTGLDSGGFRGHEPPF